MKRVYVNFSFNLNNVNVVKYIYHMNNIQLMFIQLVSYLRQDAKHTGSRGNRFQETYGTTVTYAIISEMVIVI